MNLTNKTALVTGASSGLGKAVTELLASRGVKVFALARSIEKTTLPDSVVKVTCNIRDLVSIDAAFALVNSQTSQIDILINCAGRALNKKFENTTRDEIMDVFGINLKGNIYIALEVYKRMLEAQAGHIINVGSTSSIKARGNETIYCASKWGLRGFTESLRLEAVAHKIKVSGVYPGGMQSDFWKNEPDKDISSYMKPELVAKQIVNLLEIEDSLSGSELVIERM